MLRARCCKAGLVFDKYRFPFQKDSVSGYCTLRIWEYYGVGRVLLPHYESRAWSWLQVGARPACGSTRRRMVRARDLFLEGRFSWAISRYKPLAWTLTSRPGSHSCALSGCTAPCCNPVSCDTRTMCPANSWGEYNSLKAQTACFMAV